MNHIHAIAAALLVFGLGASGFQILRNVDAHRFFAPAERQLTPASDSFTRETAASLIRGAVETHPLVARLRVGEVVIVDSKGHTSQEYELLARAKLIDLRLCRFPGTLSGPRRICLAALTESARQYTAGAETPVKIIEVAAPELPGSTNFQLINLVVGQPKLVDILEIKNGPQEQKIVTYKLGFEPTPVSQPLGISASNLSGFEAEIRLRRTNQEWRIES